MANKQSAQTLPWPTPGKRLPAAGYSGERARSCQLTGPGLAARPGSRRSVVAAAKHRASVRALRRQRHHGPAGRWCVVLGLSAARQHGGQGESGCGCDADSGHVMSTHLGLCGILAAVDDAVIKDGQTVITLHYRRHVGISIPVKGRLDCLTSRPITSLGAALEPRSPGSTRGRPRDSGVDSHICQIMCGRALEGCGCPRSIRDSRTGSASWPLSI
jgi:hypothetical protein